MILVTLDADLGICVAGRVEGPVFRNPDETLKQWLSETYDHVIVRTKGIPLVVGQGRWRNDGGISEFRTESEVVATVEGEPFPVETLQQRLMEIFDE